METTDRAALIAQYADGYNEVLKTLDGIDAEGWEAREALGEWCPRQIVHHLGDSEMNGAIRIRRIIAEENPLLQAGDEELWAAKLHYDLPVELSLEAFRFARESTAQLLRALDDEEWARPGQHSEMGEYGAMTWLRYFAAHAHDHADQIRRARSPK